MSEEQAPRPQQVTAGGLVSAIAGGLLLFWTYDSMANLRSIDTREQISKALDGGRGRDLGVSVEQATQWMHAGLLVLGAAAAAVVVLGLYSLRRNNTARIVLSVLAVVVVLISMVSDPVLGMGVGVGAVLLWSGPARDWFAGRPVRETPSLFSARPDRDASEARPAAPPAPPASQVLQDQPTPPPSRQQVSAEQPPPHPGFGAPLPSYDVATAVAPTTRAPRIVRSAAVITWLAAGSMAVLTVLSAVIALGDRQFVLDEAMKNPTVRDANLDPDMIMAAVVVVAIGIAAACLLACVLAFLVVRGHDWARWLLVVLAVLGGLVLLAGVPVSLLHIAACGAVAGMLFSAPARAWFTGPRGPSEPQEKPPVW